MVKRGHDLNLLGGIDDKFVISGSRDSLIVSSALAIRVCFLHLFLVILGGGLIRARVWVVVAFAIGSAATLRAPLFYHFVARVF